MPHFSSLVRSQSAASPGVPASSQTLPPAGPTTPRAGAWELLRVIHRGACTDVCLARPADSAGREADYVVKLLRDEVADDPVARRMLAHEQAIGAALQHPHIIPVLDSQLRGRPRHLVLPRLEGVTLAVMAREGQCDVRRALRSVRQTAEALTAVHELKWRHGDVKPANVIVSPVGHATLIDFSMAAPADQPLAGAHGTAGFAAPESDDGQIGCSGDIYSLGATLHLLLTGRLPVPPANPLSAPVLAPLPPRLPHGGAQLLRRMLAGHPDDRPAAPQVVDELTPLEIAALAEV